MEFIRKFALAMTKITHTLALVALLLMLPIAALADTLTGTVRNAEGKGIPHASVYIERLKKGAMADAEGHYELTGLSAGRYELIVSYQGYKTLGYTVEVKGRTQKDLTMQEPVVALREVVVLPEGVDYATYIMNQLQKHIVPLKKRIAAYDCHVEATLMKNIDLHELPKKGAIRFGAALVGWKKVFDILMKYPYLSLTMSENVHYRKGSTKGDGLKLRSTSPTLTESERKAIMKKDWYLDANPYDVFYDEVEKKIKSLKSKKSKYKLSYKGSYQEGKHTIHILTYGHTRVEVVDGCWQIRRFDYKSSSRTIYFEFQEMAKGVFLPVGGHGRININYAKFPKGEVGLQYSYDYSSILSKR